MSSKTQFNEVSFEISEFSEVSKTKIILPAGFTRTWHAGADITTENTVGSIEHAVLCNADIVEFDVSFRPDGTPCVIHKEQPEQDEGADFEELVAAVAKSSTTRINLDLKAYSNLPDVERIIGKFGLTDRVFYTGVFFKNVQIVSSTSSIRYYINLYLEEDQRNSEEFIKELCDKLANCNSLGLNCDYTCVTQLMVDYLHKAGLLISVWTPSTFKDITSMLALGVDNITTRSPAKLYHCIDNLQRF